MSAFLDRAMAAHVQWKIKLLAAVKGGAAIDRATCCVDNNCELGRWIHGEGVRHASKPEFKELKEQHRQFHAAIGKVVDLIAAGKAQEATKELEQGGFSKHSNSVVQAIGKLKASGPIS